MNSPRHPTDRQDVSNEAFGELLEEIAQQLRQGASVDVADYRRRYPEYAEQIVQMLPTLKAMVELGVSGDGLNKTNPNMEPKIPHKTLGDFRIAREIGRGGMGVVYEAEQRSLGRTVALKVLPFAAVLAPRAITRFQNEARAAATLDHPNIVPVISVGNDHGVYYYAMSLINGMTLSDLINELRHRIIDDTTSETANFSVDDILAGRRESSEIRSERQSEDGDQTLQSGLPDDDATRSASRLSDQPTHRDVQAAISTPRSLFSTSYFHSAAQLGIQAAEALDHAHQHGVVHRDIKPGNLMIDHDSKLWVTDFGLARIESDPGMTMTGDLIGTLRYMAPEQALAKRVVVDHRVDVYALGVTLYELLTLSPTYDAGDREKLLHQIAFEEPKPLRALNRSIPRDLETIVLKSIAKNPDERYATAQAMADDLHAFVANEPIKATPPTIAQLGNKWALRHKTLVAAAVIFLLLSTIGLAISNAMIGQERNAAQLAQANERDQRLEADHQRDEANRQKQIAEANFQKSLETVDAFLTTVSEDVLLDQPGMQSLRADLLEKAIDFYEDFAQSRSDDPAVQEELAKAYMRAGYIQLSTVSFAESLSPLQKALKIWQRLADAAPGELTPQLGLAETHSQFAQQQRATGNSTKFTESVRRMEQIIDRLRGSSEDRRSSEDSENLLRMKVLVHLHKSAPEFIGSSKLQAAQKALALTRTLRIDHEEYLSTLAGCQSAVGYGWGGIARAAADGEDALAAFDKGIANYQLAAETLKRAQESNPSLDGQWMLAVTYRNVGVNWIGRYLQLKSQDSTQSDRLKALAASVENHRLSLAVLEQLTAENPLVFGYSRSLASTHFSIGGDSQKYYVETGDFDHVREAMVSWIRSSQIYSQLLARFPDSTKCNRGRLGALKNCSVAALNAAKNPVLDDAEKAQILQQALQARLSVPDDERYIADWGYLGQILYQLNRHEDSLAAFEEVVSLRGETEPTCTAGPRWWYLSILLAKTGKIESARRNFQILSLKLKVDQLRKVVPNAGQIALRNELAELLEIDIDDTPTDPSRLLERALQLEIREAITMGNLGASLGLLCRDDESKRAYLAAAECLTDVDPMKRTLLEWYQLGHALYFVQRYADARVAFEKWIELSPQATPTITQGNIWWLIALSDARTGNLEGAKKYFQQLTQQYENHPAPPPIPTDLRTELALLLGIDEEG